MSIVTIVTECDKKRNHCHSARTKAFPGLIWSSFVYINLNFTFISVVFAQKWSDQKINQKYLLEMSMNTVDLW